MITNHYKVLGINQKASLTEIKQAVHEKVEDMKLLLANTDDDPQIKEDVQVCLQAIKAAYHTLSNPIRRRAHDLELEQI